MRIAVVSRSGRDDLPRVVAVVGHRLVDLAPLVRAAVHPGGPVAGLLSAVLAAPVHEQLLLADEAAHLASKPGGHMAVTDAVRWHAPYVWGAKVLCQVVNYLAHGTEAAITPPSKPFMFYKPASSVVGPYEPVVLHPASDKPDYECEMAAVIGRPGRNISADDAYDHIAGYVVVNDVSYRDYQFNEGHDDLNATFGRNWTKGKGLDNACVMGPWITLTKEDPYGLRMRTWVNGRLRQDAMTSDALFRLPELIAEASAGTTLQTGDVIATGTPGGVGLGTGDWLREGDEVVCEVEGLGQLRSSVVRDDAAAAGRP